MRSFSITAKVSGVAVATAALVGAGLFSANAVAAEDRPIDPADAPEIMERPWPEHGVGETHANVWVVSNYLTVEFDDNGDPYWPHDPTEELDEELSEAIEQYQQDNGMGDHGHIHEELWGHFSEGQFGGAAFDWGPGDGRDFYTQGDSGEGVESVQYMLIDHGYLDEDEPDGQYGPVTEEAVEDFQANEVCPELSISQQDCVDGLAGAVTYRALVTIE